MNKINTDKRTEEAEIMDDFDLQGEELEKTLNDLDNINKWLGGNKITLDGVKELLQGLPKEVTYSIADVGCGNGAVLREIAKWGRSNSYKLQLFGIDANEYAMDIGRKLSVEFPEIKFKSLNIFSETYKNERFDVVLCTLTLHHFKDAEIVQLMQLFIDQSRLGVVINDLQRSKIAYRLFQAFCFVFINNEIARKDGLISILRGFKKEDLEKYSKHISAKNQEITWKWAFRYQWIIQK